MLEGDGGEMKLNIWSWGTEDIYVVPSGRLFSTYQLSSVECSFEMIWYDQSDLKSCGAEVIIWVIDYLIDRNI